MDLPQLRHRIAELEQHISALQNELAGLIQEESLRTHEELQRAVDNLNRYFRLPQQLDYRTQQVIEPPVWTISGRNLQLGREVNRMVTHPQYKLSRVPEWVPLLEAALVQLGLPEEQRLTILNALQGVGSNVVSLGDETALHYLAI